MYRLALILTLLAGSAFGQTYVRPSKGTPLTPFTNTSWPDAGYIAPGGGFNVRSVPYDWSAFEAVRIRVSGSGNFNQFGAPCAAQVAQYTVAEIGSYMRVYLNFDFATLQLSVEDAPAPTGPWTTTQTQNARVNLDRFVGCTVLIQLTPLPFAQGVVYPASADAGFYIPVTISGTVSIGPTSDAGVAVTVPYCQTTRSTNTSVGTAATAVPADGGLPGRWMVRLCNSARNSGVPIITCATSATPDAGLNGIGEALEVGDCATYTTGNTVLCISDTAATSVSAEECQ